MKNQRKRKNPKNRTRNTNKENAIPPMQNLPMMQNMPMPMPMHSGPQPIRKVILKTNLSPGDLLMLSAAVRDIKAAYSHILIDVRTPVGAIWENSPHLTQLNEKDSDVEVIDAEYPLINVSNNRPYHFIHGYRFHLEEKLGLKIPCGDFRGQVFISELEKSWISKLQEMGIDQNFWILMSGGKWDYTAKWWNPDEYQKVVDHFKDKILFVQCGESSHYHPELKNVINLVGQTDGRQFIRLMYHAAGVVCPVTYAMHLAAAVETKRKMPVNRACVVIAGGREPTHWEAYPYHRYLSLMGAMDCCENGGCWRSRAFPLNDGDEKDKSLCQYPIDLGKKVKYKRKELDIKIPKCLDMITHKDVIRAIETYYEGGSLTYDGGWTKADKILTEKSKETQETPEQTKTESEDDNKTILDI
tara:strand:- start:10124 stop:11365 length:1242 start_codon:yes stop_codon:yes gene_type:complete